MPVCLVLSSETSQVQSNETECLFLVQHWTMHYEVRSGPVNVCLNSNPSRHMHLVLWPVKIIMNSLSTRFRSHFLYLLDSRSGCNPLMPSMVVWEFLLRIERMLALE